MRQRRRFGVVFTLTHNTSEGLTWEPNGVASGVHSVPGASATETRRLWWWWKRVVEWVVVDLRRWWVVVKWEVERVWVSGNIRGLEYDEWVEKIMKPKMKVKKNIEEFMPIDGLFVCFEGGGMGVLKE
ncbi:hypothetical protein HanIR_Chr17g0868351 [Helianthus annuus]|nr:hypothetical protein HanIR_Chr17g0868351 [Helianthus annuus]